MKTAKTPLFRRSKPVHFPEYNLTLEYSVNITRNKNLRVECVAVDEHPPELPETSPDTTVYSITVETKSGNNNSSTKTLPADETCLPIHKEKRLSQPVLFTESFSKVGNLPIEECYKINIEITPQWDPLSHETITIDFFPLLELL